MTTLIVAGSAAPYLTEASLGDFLRQRLDAEVIADKTVPGLEQRYRPDYRSERFRLVVEFDGDQHYRSAAHVLRDGQRDRHLQAAGYRTIRIPYFVQLTEATIADLFPQVQNRQPPFDFPHGFISNKVVFPADFCELGIERFRRDIERFAYIAGDIMESLAAAAERQNWRTVYPPSLYPGSQD